MSKPELELSGGEGNILAIIGKARRVAKKAGWSEDEIKKFTDEIKSGDYDHALEVCFKYFEVN